ncbi:MAG: IPT/TIG domain-containing protein, partial [Candidatus Poribacteria bacterium]|nr:IPT/TIG domain-containing protein [Candidatus Poribacteria bacterium]
TTISVTVPASSAGLVDVMVTNTDGQTATLNQAFTYNPAPTLTGLTPIESPLAGDITVTLTGTGFLAGATVEFGAKEASSVEVDASGTTISATVPASSAGAVDVTVTNSDGQAGTLPQAFTYNPAPTLASLTPIESPLAGGITVTLTGTGFLAGATVTFGDKTVDVEVDAS